MAENTETEGGFPSDSEFTFDNPVPLEHPEAARLLQVALNHAASLTSSLYWAFLEQKNTERETAEMIDAHLREALRCALHDIGEIQACLEPILGECLVSL